MRDHADEKVEIILVGNKNDLEKQRQISREEGLRFAEERCKFCIANSFQRLGLLNRAR